LADDPVSLPAALLRVWGAGDAAIVAPAAATLPAAAGHALAEGLPLPHGTALVVPTSGSTGVPRAVVLTHAALAASTTASITALGCRHGERWALALPLRHVAGLQVLSRARALGTAVHVVEDGGAPQAIAAAAAHAEHIALVPTQLVRCLDAGVDLSPFRTVLVGGGPLAPERVEEARAQGVRLVQSYGMTETSGGCVYDGRPLDGVTFGIAREDEGEGIGRIRLRGPMLAAGYLAPDAHDAARFADGWFMTDDLGRVTQDGTLEVLGRVDDIINTGGVKVDPVVVASLLRTDPSVRDVLVLGVADAEWGERVRAVVVPSDPSDPPTLDGLRARVTAVLPAAHAPRELVLTGRIERDGLGKVSAAERARLGDLPGS
jgi:O-succinylbenzoic acid--CoA ligase